jgi:hypothetical protein
LPSQINKPCFLVNSVRDCCRDWIKERLTKICLPGLMHSSLCPEETDGSEGELNRFDKAFLTRSQRLD